MSVVLIPITEIGEIAPGDDLARLIVGAASRQRIDVEDGDVVVITHKVVSKAEGAIVACLDDADYRRVIAEQGATVLRRRGNLVITETKHGFVCANAGVDRSNAPPGTAVLLPEDPDRSAHALRTKLERAWGVSVAVVITDTFGRAWRRGVVDVAIGVSGMPAIVDLRGTVDAGGRHLAATEVALADEVAAAADLVMGKARHIPACVVRGLEAAAVDGRGADLVRPPADDLFR